MNNHTQNAIWIGLNNNCFDVEELQARITYLKKNGSNLSADEDKVASTLNTAKVNWQVVADSLSEGAK